jgi:predicted Zn-dependent protease
MTRHRGDWCLRVVLLLTLLVGVSTVPACITDPVTGEKSFGLDMSDDDEIALGNSYAPSFKAQYEGAYPEQELQRHCERIVLGMAHTSHRKDLPWNFTILNSSEVNAFALPGGTVCMTRGLLWRMDSESMFAGVMGHEIGHVTHKHAVKGRSRQMLLGGLLAGAAYIAGQSDSEWASLAVTLGAGGVQLLVLPAFSRSQESESDLRGVEYSYRAGYDPREIARVFEIFAKLKGEGGPPEWMSTHPLDANRIKATKREVRKRYPEVARTDAAGLKKSTPEWDRLIGQLRSQQKVYDEYDAAAAAFSKASGAGETGTFSEILQSLESCRAKLPNHAVFSSAIGVVLYRMEQPDKARSYFTQAARQQADLFEPHLYLAQIAYEKNDATTAHAQAKLAEKIYPIHPRPFFIRARSYDAHGDHKNAAKKYAQVLERASQKSPEYTHSAQRLGEYKEQGILP